jgi:hypothetical protein
MIAIYILAFIIFAMLMQVFSKAVHVWRSQDGEDF